MTSRTSVRLPPVQTVGVEVGRKESVWGREGSGNFPCWNSRASVAFGNPRFFLAGNLITDEQRNKEQKSRRKGEEHEKKRKFQ